MCTKQPPGKHPLMNKWPWRTLFHHISGLMMPTCAGRCICAHHFPTNFDVWNIVTVEATDSSPIANTDWKVLRAANVEVDLTFECSYSAVIIEPDFIVKLSRMSRPSCQHVLITLVNSTDRSILVGMRRNFSEINQNWTVLGRGLKLVLG